MSRAAKLPVVDTVFGTFGFAFKRFLTVFKVALLPSIILMGPILYLVLTQLGGLMETIIAFAEATEGSEPSEEDAQALFVSMMPFLGVMMLMLPLQMLYVSMIAVPLHRAIVLDEKPGIFRLDGLVWRYFFGQIVFLLLIVAISLVVFIPMGIGIGLIESSMGEGENAGVLATVGLFFIGMVLFLFLVIRLSLFMVEISVSGQFGVRAAFAKTSGNVWRIIGAGLLYILLFIGVAIVMEIINYGFIGVALVTHLDALEAAGESEDIAAIFAVLKDMAVSPLGGIYLAVMAVMSLFVTGLEIAFPAMMYRNLGGAKA